jgi:hypothetical protein
MAPVGTSSQLRTLQELSIKGGPALDGARIASINIDLNDC